MTFFLAVDTKKATNKKPTKLGIVSSPEITSSINAHLHELLFDASSVYGFDSYVEEDGSTFMRIECAMKQDKKTFGDQIRQNLQPNYISV